MKVDNPTLTQPKFLYLDQVYSSKNFCVYRTRTAENSGYIISKANDNVTENSDPRKYPMYHDWNEVFASIQHILQPDQILAPKENEEVER